jgi:hypothetical protein
MNYAKSWDCRENPLESPVPTWTNFTERDAYERLPIIANPMCSTHTGFGCDTNCSEADYPYGGVRKSEDNLMQFIAVRGNTKPHLTELFVPVL